VNALNEYAEVLAGAETVDTEVGASARKDTPGEGAQLNAVGHTAPRGDFEL
jgi:hypothetical protein